MSTPLAGREPAAGVLVLSGRADVREILARLIADAGHEPHLPLDDESADHAAARVRPCVAIIDIDHPAARSGRLAPRLAAAGTRPLFCGAWHQEEEARRAAERATALCFTLPIAPRDFELLLRTALLLQ
ncbi:MAG TPA: hypothetical protein VF041_08360 [Gemmatimonadaceae bacterium]